ncbi:DNA-binding transcriptional regulator, Lrp family [Cupriavidus necator]|uniref:siroheme decarboxylase n=1 Tax=Cupriavidus necator (strain ATCC 17699 / DSM 428 / KCTC 22496 / NCIMB 10442 / H16 / Stanier 337) TaxID=381666 RepID=Q0JYW2_CUPNH|nr:Lrp/AsnC family transcriptional regulator [Cupriavidus necator]QCC04841.1 Lrp/AsnC family transcriptional regulator [Cupriavidus necator H16]QQB79531.1 Lrp/AsnC family transcriptional regulator [Cupriavidus necator]WKA43769.1 Lrp/AsnC family transcriptional regulator [Cupriavidus necator]CAJ97062.1 heme d1 biosynthesis protein (NirD) [Cupriavidus necator H16]
MYDELSVYDTLQRDFPLQPRPYQALAGKLGLCEHTLLSLLARDLGNGRISRVGAVFAPNVIGVSTLAALSVPPAQLDRVAARVSACAAVSHNYARSGHPCNLWFVAGARERRMLDVTLASIGEMTGLAPLDLPMAREYHIDLGFPLARPGSARARRAASAAAPAAPVALDDDDWRLVAALEAGLPLTPRPFHALAAQARMAMPQVLERLTRWSAQGVIRRLGVVLQHGRFGFGHNAMCVWDVPDAHVDAIGMRLARLARVTLCYRRARRLPDWPYNLFAMVHARNAQDLLPALARIHATAGLEHAPGTVLVGTRCYKQRGTRYAMQVSA